MVRVRLSVCRFYILKGRKVLWVRVVDCNFNCVQCLVMDLIFVFYVDVELLNCLLFICVMVLLFEYVDIYDGIGLMQFGVLNWKFVLFVVDVFDWF